MEKILRKPFVSYGFWLAFATFFTGASGLVYEYLLSTTSSYINGNSVEQFSLTIALMLFAMGLAGFLQKKVSDSYLIEKFVILEVLLSLLGGFSVVITYFSFAYLENYELIYYLTAFTIGLLIGFEIPLVMRINEKFVPVLKDNLSYIYSADYVGAFVGALLWVFVILKHFTLIQAGFVVAVSNLIVAGFTYLAFRKEDRVKSLILLFLVIGLVANGIGFLSSHWIEKHIYKPLFNQPVIFHKTTRYQDITITKNKKTGEIRLYLNGNLQFCSSDEMVYHELLVHPAMALAGKRKNILILGGGDGLALREVLKYREVKQVTLVDLDPEMIRIAKGKPLVNLNRGSFFSEKVKVINMDADLFAKENVGKKHYDVIIVDLPDPSTVELAKLYSLGFYRKLYYLLNPDGIMVVQSTSPYFAPKAFKCIEKTIKKAGFSVLPYHYDVPSFGDWGFIIGYKFSSKKFKYRLNHINFPVSTRFLTEKVFYSSLAFGKNWINAEKVKVNTVFNPVILKYYND
ncbi:polyamine aminopropyltransferase, partial [Desulfurobacterium sp.]|uniref:polyamine aminopropyltransferase n=1 Tax=Desulfurobacterium sp. TaxID=2004706 RepID=UPI002623B053